MWSEFVQDAEMKKKKAFQTADCLIPDREMLFINHLDVELS